ncbi:MAG: hypothetical protein ACYSX1_11135, partial [Planctomycetota bacterium]
MKNVWPYILICALALPAVFFADLGAHKVEHKLLAGEGAEVIFVDDAVCRRDEPAPDKPLEIGTTTELVSYPN